VLRWGRSALREDLQTFAEPGHAPHACATIRILEHVLDLCRAGAFKPQSIPAKVFAFEDADDAWLDRDLRTVVTRI
jgi:hypothetical protein